MTTEPTDPAEAEKLRKKKEDADNIRAIFGASSELLFVVLPFIVIGITLAHRGEFRSFLLIPEWSIVSAVIVGQSIVKITFNALGEPKIKKEAITFVIAILLVFLLVPILIVLAIVLTSQNITTTLAASQAIFFVLSALIFWLTCLLESYVKAGTL
jgi:hypothetical protein